MKRCQKYDVLLLRELLSLISHKGRGKKSLSGVAADKRKAGNRLISVLPDFQSTISNLPTSSRWLFSETESVRLIIIAIFYRRVILSSCLLRTTQFIATRSVSAPAATCFWTKSSPLPTIPWSVPAACAVCTGNIQTQCRGLWPWLPPACCSTCRPTFIRS